MERKIGEIFEYNGEWYQCVGGTCRNCSFYYDTVCKNITTIGSTNFGNCHCSLRTDHKSVIFKKLEKVGEPYQYIDGIYQQYKATLPFFIRDATYIETVNGFAIKIKQNKEDMEEEREYSEEEFKNNPRFKHHKLIEQVSNMKKLKPFNLEQAKAGKPVCTRNGQEVRIICFDAKLKNYPIVALVKEKGSTQEYLHTYTNEGRIYYKNPTHSLDLVMP